MSTLPVLKIIPDSSCDLSPEMMLSMEAERKIPFYMHISGEEFCDDESLRVDDLISRMKASTEKMSSSCASPEMWKDAFIKAEGGFGITISSKLSGMYQAAGIGLALAREEHPELSGHVFDSKSAACGEVLLAVKIREFIEKKLKITDIVQKIEHFADEMKTFFVLDDVSNLVKNGRMGKITGTIISVLGIKPILGAKNGEIELYGKVRGTSNVVGKLLDTIAECGRRVKGEDLVITHCNNPELADDLGKNAKHRFDFGRITILPTGGLSSFYACDKGIILSF